MTDQRILCIYHAPCADGFTSAWVVRKRFGESGVQFHEGHHGEAPPDVTGRHVVIADFSYKLPVLREMADKAASILVLDHHKSAQADLAGLPHGTGSWESHMREAEMFANSADGFDRLAVQFDMDHSGCVLAWRYFFPELETPNMLLHVEDRDLWRFRMHDTRELSSAFFSFEYTFGNWDSLARDCAESTRRHRLIVQGLALERKQEKDIAELLPLVTRPMCIGGYTVPVANLPYTLASDAGQALAKNAPFAATYYDSSTHRNFSLRSSECGIDVSEIARAYGGGGHEHAAGFRMPIGWEGDTEAAE